MAGLGGGNLLKGAGGNDLVISNNNAADTLFGGGGNDTCYRDSSDEIGDSFVSNELVESGQVDIFENYLVG